MRSGRSHRCALAVATLLAVACGSTAPVAPQAAPGTVSEQTEAALDAGNGGLDAFDTTGGMDDGLADPSVGSDATGGGEIVAGDKDAPGGAPAGAGASGDATAADRSPSTAGGQPATGGGGGERSNARATGPGVSRDTIHVGMFFVNDGDRANEATGFESTSADARHVYNAILEDVNRRGGVLGRELKPVYYRGSAVTSQTVSEQAQAACAHWHQDNKVFGVLGFPHPVALECTQKVGGVSVYAGLGIFLSDTFQRYPAFVEVSGMDVERQAAVTIDGLQQQGYFRGGAPTGTKVGILTFDTAGFHRAVDRVAVPALARHGHGKPEVAYITPPQRAQEVGNSSSEVQSAILRFKSVGVTHVIILEGAAGIAGGGHLMFLFTNQAEPQAYRPRYGLNSGVGLNGVSPQTPEGQLDGARAVGWVDPYDMPESKRLDNATVRRCRRIMKRAGLPSEGFTFADSLLKCEQVFFFVMALDRAGAPHHDAFVAGVNAIGTGYTSGVALATRFSPDQHDGVAAVRNAKYVPSCRCFHPTSKPYRP